MAPIVTDTHVDDRFVPIYLESLRIDSVLGFDLYLKQGDRLILYRNANLPFTEKTRRNLADNGVACLFITGESKPRFQSYIEKNLSQVLRDPAILEEKKAGILYQTSTNLIRDVLARPTLGENIRRSKNVVTNTVEFILKGREAFLNLLKITSFDYYTYTHSVNVCTFSVALARQYGYHDEQFLNELGIGALLHDVGKSRVSERILNKRSKLSPIEFEIMKKHPQWGVEILSETGEVSPVSHYPVLQHHERGTRQGYPNGLSLDEMHLYSRIVAIADSFDAMTTQRVYQRAMDTFPALKIMMSMKGAFDEGLLKAFVTLLGPAGLGAV
ncbi:MAG: HD-GYP domain-containing protein [Candidatus Zixiibacteriota bacterium]